MKINRTYKSKIIVAILICLIVGITFAGMIQYILGTKSLWKSDTILEQMQVNSENGHLQGPYTSLKKGTYEVTIEYVANSSNHSFYISAEGISYDTIKSATKVLNMNKTEEKNFFYLSEDVSGIECRINYDTDSELNIKSILIEETSHSYRITLFYCIVFAIALLCCLVLYIKYLQGMRLTPDRKLVIVSLVAISLIASIPIFCDYIYDGHDLNFHLTRIEGLKEGMLSGQFPVRVQPVWINGAGYGVGMGYGDLFLLIPALLRMIGFPVQTSYQFFLFCCNVATCFITYWSIHKITKNQHAAIVGTLLYTLSPYRLSNMYVRAAVGEQTAMIFLPLVIAGMWIIFTSSRIDGKHKRMIWLPLAFGMAGVIQTHILTFEMVVGLLIIICLIYCVRLFREGRIWLLIKAAIATVLLNLWFIVPLLELLTGNYDITKTVDYIDIERSGTFITQLFLLFPKLDPLMYDNIAYFGIFNEMPLVLGFPLLAIGVLGIYVFCTDYHKEKRMFRPAILMQILGWMLVIMTLHSFPWNKIETMNGIFLKVLKSFEYIWRLLSPATALLTVSGAIILTYCMQHMDKVKGYVVLIGAAGLALITGMSSIDSLMTANGPYRVYTDSGIDTRLFDSTDHFLPADMDLEYLNEVQNPSADEQIQIGKYEPYGMNFQIEVWNRGKEGIVNIPFVFYPGYDVYMAESGQRLASYKNEQGMLSIILPEDTSGTLVVHYTGKWYWNVATMISIVSIITILIYLCFTREKRNEIQCKSKEKMEN